MERNQQINTIAHFRKNHHTKQCMLNFAIRTNILGLSVSEEIKISLDKSEKIFNLISRIQQELKNLLKTKFNRYVEDIYVSFKIGKKHVNGKILLDNFPTPGRNPIILQVFDQKHVVSFNDPLIIDMSLPPVVFAECSIQPATFVTIFTNNKLSEYTWYKSLDQVEWIKCGTGYEYKVKLEDVDHYLKLVCIPVENRKRGPMAEAASQSKVQYMKDFSTFPFHKRHEFTKSYLQDFTFRVVSYNTPSKRYTQMDEKYSYCDPTFLSIDYRTLVLFKELLGFKADIICLQEIHKKIYKNYFRRQFQINGYYCYYNSSQVSEGFGLFIRQWNFRHVHSMHVQFGQEVQSNPNYSYIWDLIKRNEDLKNEFVKMPTSLQVTVLRHWKKKYYVIVGNTHFTDKPESNHLRLLHINMTTSYMETLKRTYEENGAKVAVILCGNFNSQPDQSLYEYVTKGMIDPAHEDCLKVSENGMIAMYHCLGMESACGTPKFTNYTKDFKGCLDYIFIESEKLKVRQVIPMTEEEELAKHEGLPNEYFPSDHLPLVVDLKFKLGPWELD
nr:2',5'-phosphodiesterase 12-like [Leptinotarsa decemlineata]